MTLREQLQQLCAEQEAERRRSNPELQAALDAIDGVWNTPDPRRPLTKLIERMARSGRAVIIADGEVIRSTTPLGQVRS